MSGDSHIAELLRQHYDRATGVLDPYVTHTTRMVMVLTGLVERDLAMTQSLCDFVSAPTSEHWQGVIAAKGRLALKVDELIEAYRDSAEDSQALLGLSENALNIVRVVVAE